MRPVDPAVEGSNIVLWPNFGAEEGTGWRKHLKRPEVTRLYEGWRRLVVGEWRLDALSSMTGFVPWLVDKEAAAEAARRGLPVAGAMPDVVASVHHKAWVRRALDDLRLDPEPLRGLFHEFTIDPARARSATSEFARLEAEIAERVAGWPSWVGPRFVLKPCWATSGRGRVPGSAQLDARGRRALPRLAARGGFVLEPWFERLDDVSIQLAVHDDRVDLLGTTRMHVTPSGVYVGNSGVVDDAGRPSAGTPFDDDVVAVALALGERARVEGFRGPCGIDGFRLRGPGGEPVLRAACELNARFTGGTVLAGAVGAAVRDGRLSTGDAFDATGGGDVVKVLDD